MYAQKRAVFHKDVFLPEEFKEQTVYRLKLTAHAEAEAQADRYGTIRVPRRLDTGDAVLIEATAENTPKGWVVAKRLYRVWHDEENDLVMSVTPEGRVLTVWLNRRIDRHRTLDRSRYATKASARM